MLKDSGKKRWGGAESGVGEHSRLLLPKLSLWRNWGHWFSPPQEHCSLLHSPLNIPLCPTGYHRSPPPPGSSMPMPLTIPLPCLYPQQEWILQDHYVYILKPQGSTTLHFSFILPKSQSLEHMELPQIASKEINGDTWVSRSLLTGR